MLPVDKKIILAPMAGITDLPFRVLCKELGADLLYSEMLSATGLTFNKAKNLTFVNSCRQDFPLHIQLFGSDPEHFKEATKVLDRLPDIKTIGNKTVSRRPEGIDINFGCPVKKVMKQNSGCALMRDPELSREIIKAVLDNTSLPVSLKIRAGIDNVNALEFLQKTGDLAWETIIIHGRTYKEGFSGPIDFELIRKIKKLYPQKTVIANGGIGTPEDAKETLKKTNVDGVAIARGCLGNPWIFKNTKEYLQSGTYKKTTLDEIKKIALRHIDYFLKYKGAATFREMRKHLGWYFKGSPGVKEIRKKLYEVETAEETKKIIVKS